MKKILALFTALVCALGLLSCAQSTAGPQVVKRIEMTPEDAMEECFENAKAIVTVPYCEMSDGTWKTEEHTYQFKLELTGRLHNASTDSTYVILSNREDITFEQAWKASGLSSDRCDYFDPEDAVIVGYLLGTEPAAAPKVWTEEEIIALFENSPTFFVRDACAIDAVTVTDFAYDMVGAVLCTLPERDESWIAFLDAEGNAYCNGIGAKIGSDPEFTYCGNGTVSLKLVTENGSVWTFRSSVCVQDDGISFKVEAPPEEP